MRRFLPRLSSASLLLTVMVLTVLPRTLFHHCDQELSHTAMPTREGVVHADTHCPICEAPAPIMDGVASISFQMEERVLGTVAEFGHSSVVRIACGIDRLRGPPAVA